MTFVSYGRHARFEETVYQAFPMHPIPEIELEWDRKTTFADQARKLLTGRTWPEVIGNRLNDGELDPSLSIWMRGMPPDLFLYYLPSHLVFASILLSAGSRSYHATKVMEALILPPSTDKAVLEKMDEELFFFESSLAENAEVRVALYKRMTKGQRICIATYLLLYWEQMKSEHTEPGLEELYMQNCAIWQNSSLQI